MLVHKNKKNDSHKLTNGITPFNTVISISLKRKPIVSPIRIHF